MGHSKKSAKQILENVQNESEMFRGSGDYRGMVEETEEEEGSEALLPTVCIRSLL